MDTISLGMIVRNEGRTLRACLQSVAQYVDEIVIGLGGESTDDTEEIAREFTDKVFHIEWENDFAAARNEVLERSTGDYFLWLDGDDVLVGGEFLGAMILQNPNIDAFYMGYNYGQDEEGNCICYLVRERVVKRHRELEEDWKWVGKVHEVLIPQFPTDKHLRVQNIAVIHHKPPAKHEADRNLKVLYAQLEEQEPNPDPRLLVYLGTENAGQGRYREAITFLQRFVKVTGWDEEQYQAQHRIADLWRTLGDNPKALKADYEAIAIRPDWPDAYFGLAETYYALGNYKAAIEWTKIGATKNVPETMLIINPLDYTYHPTLILGLAYVGLHDWEVALENFKKAKEIKVDPLVEKQIDLLSDEIIMQDVVKSFLTLRTFLGRNDEWLKVRKLYDCVPKMVEGHPDILETWQRTMRQTAHIVQPELVRSIYADNKEYTPVPEETVLQGLEYFPRTKFAYKVARRIKAKKVVDWGSSDGFTSLPLATKGIEVVGFDIDPRCVDEANARAKKWGLPARYEVGDLEDIGGVENEKADLALLFEVIEHQVNPEDTLQKIELTANHVAITTPYLSWEKGRWPRWDKDELKGHIRIWDHADLERLLSARGRIWNLYHEEWGAPYTNGWLLADYAPGERFDKNIIISAVGSVEAWNPRTWQKDGLGGSETAIIRLSEELAKQGHRPIVYSRFSEPLWYNGVCYRQQENLHPEVSSDLFIAWRSPEAADWAVNTKQLILWMHDTDAGDRLTPERARRFDKIVVLSQWHKQFMLQRYPFLKPEKLLVVGNGVDPNRFKKEVSRDYNRVIYSSSPDRGLDVILGGIWPKVLEAVPDAELHVYYGWKSYDATAQFYPQLLPFREKMDQLMLGTKNVVQHGRIPQRKLAEEMQKASIWLYPTYFSETYCITAVEAQLAGAIPVTNSLAALEETVQSGIRIDGDVYDPGVQQAYADAVIRILKNPEEFEEIRSSTRNLAPFKSWSQIATEWSEAFLRGDKLDG